MLLAVIDAQPKMIDYVEGTKRQVMFYEGAFSFQNKPTRHSSHLMVHALTPAGGL